MANQKVKEFSGGIEMKNTLENGFMERRYTI
jgi:hypothetical protein